MRALVQPLDGRPLIAIQNRSALIKHKPGWDAGMHETARLGKTIPALGVGQIVERKADTLSVGDLMFGFMSA